MKNDPDYIDVSKDQFFEIIGKKDVNPDPGPLWTVWKQRDGMVVGKSYPGYMSYQPEDYLADGSVRRIYTIRKSLATT